ncbi:hypothetical protein FHG87_022355 [Trinorchestia longiramus]|nr:hypothetical protein FHG87_022355 [Trinorchestia longiramus]
MADQNKEHQRIIAEEKELLKQLQQQQQMNSNNGQQEQQQQLLVQNQQLLQNNIVQQQEQKRQIDQPIYAVAPNGMSLLQQPLQVAVEFDTRLLEAALQENPALSIEELAVVLSSNHTTVRHLQKPEKVSKLGKITGRALIIAWITARTLYIAEQDTHGHAGAAAGDARVTTLALATPPHEEEKATRSGLSRRDVNALI